MRPGNVLLRVGTLEGTARDERAGRRWIRPGASGRRRDGGLLSTDDCGRHGTRPPSRPSSAGDGRVLAG